MGAKNRPDGERNLVKPVEELFEELIRKDGDRIFNTVYSVLGDVEATKDVVQEIYMEAYTSLPSFQGRSSLSTWLYRISMRVVADHIRSKSRRAAISAPRDLDEEEVLGRVAGESAAVESAHERLELSRSIRKALQKLPPDFRIVFTLREIDDYSYREISELLNISIGTVESRLFRAREQLRKELTEASVFPE